MWVRTVMNYQYRHGGTTTTAFTTLWRQGGIRRLYRGFGPALLQGPLARFGDTAANVALLALLDGTQVLTISMKVVFKNNDNLVTLLGYVGLDTFYMCRFL